VASEEWLEKSFGKKKLNAEGTEVPHSSRRVGRDSVVARWSQAKENDPRPPSPILGAGAIAR
jgi:hypothetical protein